MSNADFDIPETVAHDSGAEQAILGVILSSPASLLDIRRNLGWEDFYKPAHQVIYKTILKLDDEQQPIEARSVLSALTATGEIQRVPEGMSYLADLVGDAPAPAAISYYSKIVRDLATRRSLSLLATNLNQRSKNGDTDPASIIERTRIALDNIAVDRLGSEIPLVKDVIPLALAEIHKLSEEGTVLGVPTGFVDLDKQLNGLQSGQMIVVAARPGVGKSSLAMDIARNAAIRQDKSVIVFSLEMSAPELVMRMLSAESHVDLQYMKTGAMTDEMWQKLAHASTLMNNSKLSLDDTATVTLPEIRAKARAIQRIHGLDLIVIDYIQLMNSDGRSDSRQQEVSEISRGIKLLAKEFGIPVIALSQLNRGSEQRQDKRPVISDLRESGSIEQDADVVILLHREEMYEKESPRAGEADVIIAKQRSGPTGTIVLAWLGKFVRFADIAID